MQPSASATLKMYLELLVRHVRAELLPGVDGHAGVVVHRAQLLERVHRHARAPRLELLRLLPLRRLLLGRHLTASTTAAATRRLALRRAGRTAAVPRPGHHWRRRVVWRTSPRPAFARAATTATTAGTCRRASKALDRTAHQLDSADARVHDVLQRRFRTLVRHAAVAVGDRAELHAVDQRIRLRLGQRPRRESLRPSASAGTPASVSRPNSRLV